VFESCNQSQIHDDCDCCWFWKKNCFSCFLLLMINQTQKYSLLHSHKLLKQKQIKDDFWIFFYHNCCKELLLKALPHLITYIKTINQIISYPKTKTLTFYKWFILSKDLTNENMRWIQMRWWWWGGWRWGWMGDQIWYFKYKINSHVGG